jgi:hypothetical protein
MAEYITKNMQQQQATFVAKQVVMTMRVVIYE